MESERGASVVVGVMLLMGIFISAFVVFYPNYLRLALKDAETNHMQSIRYSFLEIKSNVESMVEGDSRSVNVQMSIEPPLFSPGPRPAGVLSADDIENEFNTIRFTVMNQYFPHQSYAFEGGGVILSQYGVDFMISKPNLITAWGVDGKVRLNVHYIFIENSEFTVASNGGRTVGITCMSSRYEIENEPNTQVVVNLEGPIPPKVLTNSPSSTSSVVAGWYNVDRAYADDDRYASSWRSGAEQEYGGYGFNIPWGSEISKVRVRLDAWCTTNDDIRLEVSTDGGATYLPTSSTIDLTTSEATYWVDITGWTTWTREKLNDDKIRTKVCHVRVGDTDRVNLDWIPVEVTYTRFIGKVRYENAWRKYLEEVERELDEICNAELENLKLTISGDILYYEKVTKIMVSLS